MEASSTTVNITGNVPIEVKPVQVETKHSHGPNFGRYVEGCAACMAKYPNGKPIRTKKAKDDKDAEIERLKMELARTYTKQVEAKPQSDDATRQLAEIMLRREAKQLLKDEETDKRKAEARADFLRVAKEQEAMKLARENSCSHTKENGRSAIAASQIHSDGFLHPFCMRCFKTFAKRRPNQAEMATSVEA